MSSPHAPEAALDALLAHPSVGLVRLDGRGVITALSGAAAAFVPPHVAIGRPISQLLASPEEDLPALLADAAAGARRARRIRLLYLQGMAALEPTMDIDLAAAASRTHAWWDVVCRTDEGGALLTIADVTAQADAEAGLTQLITHLRCVLWEAQVYDDAGTLRWDMRIVNEAAAAAAMPLTLGTSRSWTEAWFRSRSPDDMREANRISTNALRSGWDRYSQVVRHRMADGQTRWFRDDAVVERVTPDRWQLAGVCVDITDQQLAALAVERQNERLRRGLQLARDIQLGLLPRELPIDTPMLAVVARALPAAEVGGDFYTCQLRGAGEALVTVGDVSGKGVGAALMMALSSSTVEALAREARAPDELLAAVNEQLGDRLRENHMHTALVCALLDVEGRRLHVANAGMIAPFLVRRGRTQLVDAVGLPLGAMARAHYSTTSAPLEPGDRVVLVSDGVVEARDGDGLLFGFERLEQVLSSADPSLPLDALLDTVLAAVSAFVGGAEQGDDVTIMALEVR